MNELIYADVFISCPYCMFDLSMAAAVVRGVLLEVYAKASFSHNPWVRSRGWDALPLPSAARDSKDTKNEHTRDATASDITENEVRMRPCSCRGVNYLLVEGCFVETL